LGAPDCLLHDPVLTAVNDASRRRHTPTSCGTRPSSA